MCAVNGSFIFGYQRHNVNKNGRKFIENCALQLVTPPSDPLVGDSYPKRKKDDLVEMQFVDRTRFDVQLKRIEQAKMKGERSRTYIYICVCVCVCLCVCLHTYLYDGYLYVEGRGVL